MYNTRHHDENAGSGVIALLAGLGFGLGVGLLAAPKAGRETRAQIADSIHCGLEEAKKKSCEIQNAATEKINQGKRAFDDQARGIRQAVEAGKRAYRESVSV